MTPITDLIARTHLAADGEDPMAVDLDTPIPNNPSRLRLTMRWQPIRAS